MGWQPSGSLVIACCGGHFGKTKATGDKHHRNSDVCRCCFVTFHSVDMYIQPDLVAGNIGKGLCCLCGMQEDLFGQVSKRFHRRRTSKDRQTSRFTLRG